ncbi:MAG: hypothetical protein IJ555_13380 [Ruminococcus sp.]|nr:hypothetical protein [Ruminococcus sp.]
MNALTTRALVTVLSILILFTVGSQIYYRVNDRHKTEEAILCDINENIPFKGVVIRNESVISYPGNGVFEYLYQDGSKIAAGSAVASVYSSEQTLLKKRLSDEYSARADVLERAQNPGNAQYVQPEIMNSKIDEEYRKMLSSSFDDDYNALFESFEEYSLQMNIYNVITGRSDNYADEIARLRSESEKLDNEAVSAGVVEAPEPGYFVSYCDGYERMLSLENVYKLNQADIEAVVNGENKNDTRGSVGKIFDDYSCCIAAVIPSDKRLSEGDTVRIRLDSTDSVYKVYIEQIKDADEEGYSVIVMSCNRLDKDIVSSRVLSFELVFDSYHGIKVPREAIRFENDQKGVYVILGNETTFKKIDVIYEGSDFVVSKNTSDEEYLLLYDQILLEAVSNQNGSDKSSSS